MTTPAGPSTVPSRVVVVGGGPGGYEAALVAAHLGASVTVVDSDGLGGAAVLTDCVPSKALISTADYMAQFDKAADLGVALVDDDGDDIADSSAELGAINRRILRLARAQSADIEGRLKEVGIAVVHGRGRLAGPGAVEVLDERIDPVEPVEGAPADATDAAPARTLQADVVLLATGATPRTMATAEPDGERILTWQQVYALSELPEHVVVVGSGVTGAELAEAYLGLGAKVTLVSSRERVLPGEDPDAAHLIEDVFRGRGMEVLSRSRMSSVVRDGDRVLVTLEDGRTIEASHAILAVGSVPRTADLGLEDVGVATSPSGHITVDRVSRTTVRGVYAAGDCTGVLPLASVAAMQGRIAMAHALGDAVAPIDLRVVSANIFTDPEIATVGVSQKDVDEGTVEAEVAVLPLPRNPRAKMLGIREGFVKLFCQPNSGTVLGGVVVAPRASELIYPVTLAVQHRLNVDQMASTFTVYPSLSGSIAEAARQLHPTRD